MLNKNVDETKLPEDLKGTSINNAPKVEPDEYEEKIREAEAPSYTISVNLKLNPAQKIALDRQADDRGITPDEVVAGVVAGFLQGKIGAPIIGAPSWAKKVKGPSGWINK